MLISADSISIEKWAPVICNRLKENGHFCRSWLGALDTSTPGRVIHYCSYCKINYIHTVDANGMVEVDIVEGKLGSLDIPVEAGPADVYADTDAKKR